MKTYRELSQHQKDLAADKALAILVEQIVNGLIKPKMRKENSEFVFYWMTNMDKAYAYKVILDNDDVAEDLWPLAEEMAAAAIYPEKGEYVINEVA